MAMILTPSIVFFQQSQWNIMVLMNGCLLIIHFKYRMQDIESDHKYNLVPADYDKSVALAKIIKHVWMEAYTELAGPAFLRSYVPKTFHLIGSPAYDSSGTKVLGTAEGGKKITLWTLRMSISKF